MGWKGLILISRLCILALFPGEEGAYSGIPCLENEVWTSWAGWPTVGWLSQL